MKPATPLKKPADQPIPGSAIEAYKKVIDKLGPTVEREIKMGATKLRPCQTEFRAAMIEACGGRCVLSGNEASVEAAHVGAWTGNDNLGLLLRTDLHRMFDANPQTLSITPDGQVDIAEKFHNDPDLLRFHGMKITVVDLFDKNTHPVKVNSRA